MKKFFTRPGYHIPQQNKKEKVTLQRSTPAVHHTPQVQNNPQAGSFASFLEKPKKFGLVGETGNTAGVKRMARVTPIRKGNKT